MWSIARRPRWIAALLLALGVAAAFAALGQWQLERSFASGEILDRETETSQPLTELVEPQRPMRAAHDGQLVTVSGSFVPGDYVILSERLNDDAAGFWVVGHLVTEEPDGAGAGLAVALGWTADRQRAESVAALLEADDLGVVTLTGRYVYGEGPQNTDYENGELNALAPAMLVNVWQQVDDGGTYGGYVVTEVAASGLESISAPPPTEEFEVNWLNIFYAAEWVIFAGFAIYLWWRLVKDAWEAEQREVAAGVTPQHPAV